MYSIVVWLCSVSLIHVIFESRVSNLYVADDDDDDDDDDDVHRGP